MTKLQNAKAEFSKDPKGLKLEYDEPGMMFRGVACGRGEIIDDWEEYE